MSVDLDAYLARIGHDGSLAPTYDTLARLVRAHMARIPFENLDVLLGRPIRLDLEGVQAKLVTARRGGYCYEHATLVQAVLEQLDFRVSAHAARVVLITARTQSPRTHMYLTVALPEGRFMIDPGFGAQAPRVPIPVENGAEVTLEHERHRLVRDEWGWALEFSVGDKFVPAWVSTMEAENPIDFELANHFTSTHPKSPFTTRLMARALTEDGRVGIMNRDVTVLRGTEATTRTLADRSELRGLLREHFGFDLPEVEQLKIASVPEWQ